jgi:NAD(P)-dependent dehydrogenase (short-subunit alcohol dehydrogenase family)
MGKLDKKVAIVTGAGRGIGRAIAEGYLLQGASVLVTAAREQAELNWFLQQEWSQRVLAQLADVTDAHACEQVVAQALQHFGKVDVLVNNAGRGMKYVSSSFLTQPTRLWEEGSDVYAPVLRLFWRALGYSCVSVLLLRFSISRNTSSPLSALA